MMNMKDSPGIVFICDKAPSTGAPHQHMAAIWLNHVGFKISCICSASEDTKIAPKFSTPLGELPITYVAPMKRGLLGKASWHFRFFLRILRARWAAAAGTLFYIQGHVSCPTAWLALLGVSSKQQIYHTQDYLEPGRYPFWAFFERRVALRASTVISNEINRGRFMASHYRLPGLPLTIPTYLPKNWNIQMLKLADRSRRLKHWDIHLPPNYRIVLHQGSYAKVRCGQQVLEALNLLPKNYFLAFTGNRAGSMLEAAQAEVATRPNLKGRVFFLNEMPYAEMLQLTTLFDASLLLYPNDGVGNFYQAPGRLTENIGSGVPIVTSRFPGLELLVLKHGLGEVCNQESAEDIARAIHSICKQDRNKLFKERLRLRKVFEEHLCYDRAAPRLEQAVLKTWALDTYSQHSSSQ